MSVGQGVVVVFVFFVALIWQKIDFDRFSLRVEFDVPGVGFGLRIRENADAGGGEATTRQTKVDGRRRDAKIAIVDGCGLDAAFTYMKHIREAFVMHGYTIKTGNISTDDDWDVMWFHDFTFTNEPFSSLAAKADGQQIVNHVPGSGFYTSKVSLATCGLRIGVPLAFQLPTQKADLLKFVGENPNATWVQKDNNHRNIKIKKVADMDLDSDGAFVQRFVDNPLLIDNRKFDVGVYVVVTSLLPLRVYIFEGDVLIRFCPQDYEPFDEADVDKYVVGDDYTPMWEIPSLNNVFNKQRMTFKHAMDAYLGAWGMDSSKIWSQIAVIVAEVFRTQQSQMLIALSNAKLQAKYFELSRFDFVVDDKLNVFLMEANMSPNLSSGHFKQNQQLYEQVLMSVLSLTGVASRLTQDAQEMLRRRPGIEDPLVGDRQLHLPLKICVDGSCKSCDVALVCSFSFANEMRMDEIEECELCGSCMSDSTRSTLRDTFLEHSNRGQMRRLRFDDSEKPLTKEDRILSTWLKAKCEFDSAWC